LKLKKKVFELTEEGKILYERLFKHFSALISIAIESSLNVCVHYGCKIYEGEYKEIINGKNDFLLYTFRYFYKQEMKKK